MSVGVSRGQWVTVAQELSLTFSPPLFLKTPEDEVFIHLHVIQAKKIEQFTQGTCRTEKEGKWDCPKARSEP